VDVDSSRLRQVLKQVDRRIELLLDVFLTREPMMRGSVYVLRTRCGTAGCRCMHSDYRHSAVVLRWSERGRSRLRCLAPKEQLELKQLTDRSRRFRRARKRLVDLQKKMLDLIDRLADARCREP
jgi:hypothetical protein